MSLVNELKELKINNLYVDYLESDKDLCTLLLKTVSGKIVGIGWQVEDAFNEKEYFFWEKIQYINNNEHISGIMSQENWHHWDGKLFLFNNSLIWHISFNIIHPISESEDNLSQFIQDIKTTFPELRSSGELNDNKLNEMTSAIYAQNTQVGDLFKENEQLALKIKELYNILGMLEKDNLKKDERLAASDLFIEELIKERDYFKKEKVLEVTGSITLEQKEKLIKLLDEKSLTSIEINHHLLFPAIIVKIPTNVVIEWDSPYDKIPAATYIYQVIDINGSITDINIEEIRQNPEAIVGSKLPYSQDDLRNCINIDRSVLVF